MDNILKILYDTSYRHQLLNFNNLETLTELFINIKHLNSYVKNIEFNNTLNDNLALYSNESKSIVIFVNTIYKMIEDIEKEVLLIDNLEMAFYKNLCLLQIILHELEHAYQSKIAYETESLYSLIIRLSYSVDNAYNDSLYEFCSEERLAEINSFNEIITIKNNLNINFELLSEILKFEYKKRQIRGYHLKNDLVTVPIIHFFTSAKRKDLLNFFDLSDVFDKYNFNDRMLYGFPISKSEYGNIMKDVLNSYQNNYYKRIIVK